MTQEEEIDYLRQRVADLEESCRMAEKLLVNREAKFKGIIDNFRLGLLEVEPSGVIIDANESFCEMSGFSIDELFGKDGGEMLLDEFEKERMKERNASRSEGETDVYELRVLNKNGETRYWLVSAAPLLGDDGNIHGSIGIHWDITEMKQL
jgi:PAS domain S-box-containing protein